jgi:hypothetical protein
MKGILTLQNCYYLCILVLLAWRLFGPLLLILGDFFKSPGACTIKLFTAVVYGF